MALVDFTCERCGKKGQRQSGSLNRSRRNGKPVYCGRECNFAARAERPRAKQWWERFDEPRSTAVQVGCTFCAKPIWLPPSKVGKYRFCSDACRKADVEARAKSRERTCGGCGAAFVPRQYQITVGQGKYCSRKCIPSDHLVTPENLAIAQARVSELRKAGGVTYHRGPDNVKWKGGKKAAVRRRTESGKAAAALKVYRAKNREKVKEWKLKRRGANLGRLPYGTIPAIARAQKWKCAICRVPIKDGYHVDHIMPIARGGKHENRNLQLLCGPCNLRKSDRDPIHHMQSLGRLL